MQTSFLLATLAGLCGMLGWGFGDFFAKKTIDVVGDMVTLAWAHFAGLVLMSGLCLIELQKPSVFGQQGGVLPQTAKDWAGLAFFGALQAIVYFFVYRAFAVGKVSLLNPVFSTYSGFVVLLSVLIFGETLHVSQALVLALVFVGVLLMSIEQDSAALRRFSFKKMHGMSDIVIATVLASIWTLFWARFVNGKDWLIYATLMYAFMSLTVLAIAAAQRLKLTVPDRSIWKYFLLIGIGEVVAYAGISWGYGQTSHTSIVAVLSSAFSVPTVILARMFLGEKIGRLQVAGVVCVILGGVGLALL